MSEKQIHKRLSVFCAAKLNLFLKVCEKQMDGYHRIETVFQSIDLFDKISLEISPIDNKDKKPEINISLESSKQSHLVPTDKKNLMYQAAKLFFRKAEIQDTNLRIHIHKNIPVSGGLAGGSTNAAATLCALNYFFGELFSQTQLLDMCRELGSDVPFCLLGGCMLGTGRGDQLTRLTFPKDLVFVLVFPPSGLELKAKDVYERYDLLQSKQPEEGRIEDFIKALLSDNKSNIAKKMMNSLEEAVVSLSYWVEEATSLIDSVGYQSLVSGSGPTVFALAPNEAQGQALIRKLKEAGYEASLHRAVSEPFQLIAH